ncbi:hypothetical protein, conserved [Eimeria praecox]|uniref:Uncharacterized protein n=1 Tax=Eimeria praecox TaxID=51316 RepID=U6G793_9EIME|nr:hypothetical protein, conserved [Eimeria praecox]
MEKGVVEDRNKVIQDLFSGLYGANRKAKMVLELLGFRSAAALPEHLHAAVLQVLLMGPVGPFCRRPLVPVTNPGLMPQPIPLSSEGCVIQCLFADWLTKTSKWLKVPRYRYVMLLLIAPKPEEMEKGQQPIIMNSSIKRLTASPAGETPQIRGGDAEYAAFKQKNVQKPFPQLLLVAFKAPQERLSTGDHDYVDSYVLQRAEPSEVFTIDSTHRALCQRVQCGKEDQLVLIVEGLGGRLLVLGELSRSTASPSGTTKVQRALCQRVQCGKEDQLVLIVEGLGGRLLVLGELSRSTASPSGTTKVQEETHVQHQACQKVSATTLTLFRTGITAFTAPEMASRVIAHAVNSAELIVRTLRQLIDDQQRSLAALAVREYRRKVALVQHEYQMSRQQASRALMDEHGQLFPQVHLQS